MLVWLVVVFFDYGKYVFDGGGVDVLLGGFVIDDVVGGGY